MSIDSQINYSHISIQEIAENLNLFAERECKENAPLYYQLCKKICQDEELLHLASKVRFGQPIPNLFLSAVHYLLIQNPESELAKFYPTICGNQVSEIPFKLFKDFTLQNKSDILDLIQTKLVQTNVLNRCSFLMPIFAEIIPKENKPITIIDIGTSAGITTNWDKYSYTYDNGNQWGDGKILIQSQWKSNKFPNIQFPINQQITKIGIDQNLINIHSEEETNWLKSLVWADHIDRFKKMDSALEIMKSEELKRFKASQVSEFEEIIHSVKSTETLIIYSTFTLYQFSNDMKREFFEMLERIGKKRDFYFLSAEGIKIYLEKYQTKDIVVELTSYSSGIKTQKLVCTTDGHGNWVDWT